MRFELYRPQGLVYLQKFPTDVAERLTAWIHRRVTRLAYEGQENGSLFG
jgi:hypothetical protein